MGSDGVMSHPHGSIALTHNLSVNNPCRETGTDERRPTANTYNQQNPQQLPAAESPIERLSVVPNLTSHACQAGVAPEAPLQRRRSKRRGAQHRVASAQFDAFLVELRIAAYRAACRKNFGCRADADDIANEVVLWAMQRGEVLMTRYESAGKLANVRVKHAKFDFERRQRAQRGEGSDLAIDADGGKSVRRTVQSGDSRDGNTDRAIFDALTADMVLDDAVTKLLDDRWMVEYVTEGLSDADRRLLLAVDAYGETVSDVAVREGGVRETYSRRLSRARQHVRRRADELGDDGWGYALV